MIEEDYVNFEVAKLLKEKGFDIPCDNYYDSSGKTPNESVYGGANIETLDYNADPFIKSGFPKFKTFSAPTLQMAMKWIREVHGLNVQPCIVRTIEMKKAYNATIYNNNCEQIKSNFGKNIFDGFISYEEAVEAAIKYCLTNLI